MRVEFWLDCLHFLKHPFTVQELCDISIETNDELTSKNNYYNAVDSEIQDLSFWGIDPPDGWEDKKLWLSIDIKVIRMFLNIITELISYFTDVRFNFHL